jgi:hypothetical protein
MIAAMKISVIIPAETVIVPNASRVKNTNGLQIG